MNLKLLGLYCLLEIIFGMACWFILKAFPPFWVVWIFNVVFGLVAVRPAWLCITACSRAADVKGSIDDHLTNERKERDAVMSWQIWTAVIIGLAMYFALSNISYVYLLLYTILMYLLFRYNSILVKDLVRAFDFSLNVYN